VESLQSASNRETWAAAQRSDGFNDEADGGQHDGDHFAQGQEDQPDSAALLVRQTRPSSRKRLKEAQRLSM